MSMANTSKAKKQNVKRRRPAETQAALIKAAADEFNDVGYDKTNTNQIAIRAGFAPQTFYRHFKQKIDIFVAAYDLWAEEGMAAYDDMRGSAAAIDFAIQHHKKSLLFRRALRNLSVVEPVVRKARAASRLVQVDRLRKRLPHLAQVSTPTILANFLTVERLLDAIAEGEFTDLGLTQAQARKELTRIMKFAFGGETTMS